jgi:hypothetical protein
VPVRLATAAAVLVLSGCLSSTPIAPGAAEPVDARLLGTWRCVSPDDEATSILVLARKDPTTYSGTLAGEDENPSGFEAFLVGRGAGRLANVKDRETAGDEAWTLLRPTLYRPDLLHLEVIDHERYKAHRADLPAMLKDAGRRDELFGAFCTCVRVPAKP